MTSDGSVFEGLEVLLVEDDLLIQEVYSTLLATYGARVTSARSGAEALERAREHPPRVALIDVGLPDMTGYELAEQLAADPALASTVRIAVTGHAEVETSVFHARMLKPVEPEALAEVLEGLL